VDLPSAESTVAPLDGGGLDEIVVAARKRNEDLLDVPLSVTVVTGSTLQRDADYSIQDLAEKVPNLIIEPSNPRQTSISIRGLGKNSANDGLETSVGIYVDGVYLSQPGEVTFDLADIDQVEVLRGPQGTLFGKNNTGGVVNITTLKPSFTAAESVEAIVGDYGTYELHASATGPVSDTVAFRFSAYDRLRDGVLTNLYDGSKFNGFDRQGFRGQILWQPSTEVSVRIIGEHYESDEHAGGTVYWLSDPSYSNGKPIPLGKTLAAQTAPFGYVPVFDPWERNIDLNSARGVKTKQDAASVQVTAALGPYTLDSITAFRRYSFDAKNDGDATPLDIVDFNGTTSTNSQYSEELRLSSPLGGAFDYVGGVYVYHDDLRTNSDQLNGSLYAAFNGIPLTNPGALDGVLQNTIGTPVVDSYAGFAQGNLHFADRWTFTAGLRETDEHKSATIVNTVSGGADPATLDAADLAARLANVDTSSASTAFTESALSWMGSLSYRLDTDVNTYVTVSKGFKSGGINVEVTNVPLVVAPETAIDVEAGIKSRWLNSRLEVNANVYDSTIHDYQGNFQSTSATLGNYIANVGDVHVRGAEFEFQTLPLEGLRIGGGASYNRATYQSFTNAACPLEQPPGKKICDFSGKQLPFAPLWTAEATSEYDHTLGAQTTGYVRNNLLFRSAENVNASLSIYGIQDAYTVANFQAGAIHRSGPASYDLSIWVKNAFDRGYLTSIGTAPGTKTLVAGLGDPRTFGATLRVTF
jgi:iron complex outermembrane receptor protein